MKLLTSIFSIVLPIISLVQAEPLFQKRADAKPLGQIFAYGANITGLPLFVADGAAYLGNVTLSPILAASNVTFDEIHTSIVARQQDTNSSGTTTNSTESYLAIDTTSGASAPVLIDSLSSETNYTTDGFFVYGRQITWLTSARDMETKFFAYSTEVEGVWKLYWDEEAAGSTEGNVVVLKALPPARSH